ncbi:MAG: tetratricopeptide repeat protein [Planctomycetes bacterium]|nr:tetratricopeptide repeat protein [Planctomycetota bacterium]
MFRTLVRWFGRKSRRGTDSTRGGPAVGEIAALRRRASESPSPGTLARLAELQRLAGDAEQAIETAHRAIAAFPDHPAGHVALARIHYGRFLRTAGANDGRAAEKALLRAHEIAPADSGAIIHLAALYARVGAVQEARRVLEEAEPSLPNDRRVAEIARSIARAERARPPSHEDPFHAYEAANAGAHGAPSPLPDGGRLADGLARILTARGVASVTALAPEGEVIFARPEIDGTQVETLGAMRDAGRVSARRMSLGVFGLAGVSCPDGKLVIVDRGAATVVVAGDGDSLDDGFEERIASFVGAALGPEEIS